MTRTRILQAVAGAGLAVTGLAGLSTLPATPAVAQEEDAGHDVDMQQMMDQCAAMMDDMSQMMEGTSGSSSGGMGGMMSR